MPSTRGTLQRTARRITAAATLLLAAGAVSGFVWPWNREGPWPSGSDLPVEPLGFPAVETRIEPGDAVRFAVYGDQRALADGEWQRLVGFVAEEHGREPLSFVLDTGDVVDDGAHRNQFAFLRELLEPIADIPYLVGVGNHELSNNRSPRARRSFAKLMEGVDPALSADRLYYRKDVGNLRLLFLDSNDLVYGDKGAFAARTEPRQGSRAEAQMAWLRAELAADDRDDDALTVAVIHHPFLQSSEKHRKQATALWSYRTGAGPLPDLLLDGGVDLVLCGHTHTTERFRLRRRKDGAEMLLINVSGRPRDSVLWWGSSARQARDIAGEERDWLTEHGWTGLEGWQIVQEHAMTDDEANQCALFTLGPDASLDVEMVYLEDDEEDGVRREKPVRLR